MNVEKRRQYSSQKCFSHGSGSGAAVMSLTILICVRCWVKYIKVFSKSFMNPTILSNATFLYKKRTSLRHQDLLNIVLRGSKQDISVTGHHSRENLSSKIINKDFYCKGVSKVLGELRSRTLKRKLRSANFIKDPINKSRQITGG